jgi:hypothetical protein
MHTPLYGSYAYYHVTFLVVIRKMKNLDLSHLRDRSSHVRAHCFRTACRQGQELTLSCPVPEPTFGSEHHTHETLPSR